MKKLSTPRPSLTIVILSYNVEKLLLDCLKSLKEAKTPQDNWEILLPDNGSTDTSLQSVRKYYPQVKIIENKKNLGFAAGNNVALRQVKTKYALLLNPDVKVFPGTIQTVESYMESHPDVAAATCRVELPTGSLDYSCHRRFPNPLNSFIYFFAGFLKRFSSYAYRDIPAGIHEIDALCGAFAMVQTEVGKKLNWLDEDFWWNGEDLDFCYRIKETGKKIVYIPDVKIIHYKGSSSGLQKTGRGQASRETKIRSASAGVAAMRIFYDKHYAALYPAPFNWLVYLGMWLLKSIRLSRI